MSWSSRIDDQEPMKMKRGKEWVNGPREPKEWNNKPMGIIRVKEEVNGTRKPREWIGKLNGLA